MDDIFFIICGSYIVGLLFYCIWCVVYCDVDFGGGKYVDIILLIVNYDYFVRRYI